MTMSRTGAVNVDDDGDVTYAPNDSTNLAKRLYARLLGANSTAKVQQKVSGGGATWTPSKPAVSNPPTTQELAALRAWQKGPPTPVMTPPPPPTTVTVVKTITPDAATKQKTAELANAIAQEIVGFILDQAVVTTVIPASSAGDGLQVGHNPGDPTTHPTSPKTLSGSLT